MGGDIIVIDAEKGTIDVELSADELAAGARLAEAALLGPAYGDMRECRSRGWARSPIRGSDELRCYADI
jgi:hypothetical protein